MDLLRQPRSKCQAVERQESGNPSLVGKNIMPEYYECPGGAIRQRRLGIGAPDEIEGRTTLPEGVACTAGRRATLVPSLKNNCLATTNLSRLKLVSVHDSVCFTAKEGYGYIDCSTYVTFF